MYTQWLWKGTDVQQLLQECTILWHSQVRIHVYECVCQRMYKCRSLNLVSLLPTDKREVLVWGLNNHGQCAVDPSLPEPEATHIQPNTHTLTSTSTTDISHTTSSSSPDSVGVSSSRSSTSDQRAGSKVRCQRIVWLPGKVECLPQIAEVHCGWSHSLVVSGVDIYTVKRA